MNRKLEKLRKRDARKQIAKKTNTFILFLYSMEF
jgi:hypothetical protein